MIAFAVVALLFGLATSPWLGLLLFFSVLLLTGDPDDDR